LIETMKTENECQALLKFDWKISS